MGHYHLILLTHIFVLLLCVVPKVKCMGVGIMFCLVIQLLPCVVAVVKVMT